MNDVTRVAKASILYEIIKMRFQSQRNYLFKIHYKLT